MAYLPLSTPTSTKFTITGPNGMVAVLNDPSDVNWVGDTTEISGFDRPEVRESFEDNTEADGGTHDPFFYGRRPVVLNGNIKGHTDLVSRAIKEDKLLQATDAMRADATVAWIAPSGAAVRILVRQQNPTRLVGGWLKEFQTGLVSASHLIEAQTAKSAAATAGAALPQQLTVENQGNAEALPDPITIIGPVTNPEVVNVTAGKTIVKLTGTIASGVTYTISVKNHTVYEGSTNRYSTVDFLASNWNGLIKGNNVIELRGSGGGAATRLSLSYRDSWV